MDQETREFLQEHFGRIDDRFERVDQQFVDLRSEIDQRFEKVDQRFEKADQRFETLEEETRLTRVLVEGLQSQLQAVAESFATVDSKVDRTASELRDEIEEERTRNIQLHRRHERRLTEVELRVDLLEGTED